MHPLGRENPEREANASPTATPTYMAIDPGAGLFNLARFGSQGDLERQESRLRRIAIQLIGRHVTGSEVPQSVIESDDASFRSRCRAAGVADEYASIMFCGAKIAEMVFLYEWKIDEEFDEHAYYLFSDALWDGITDPALNNARGFVAGGQVVREIVDELREAIEAGSRKYLVDTHGRAGWAAELYPLLH